jgi:hypothetical protein
MALEQPAFDVLKSLAPCRLLSLGYPDLLLTQSFDVKEAKDWQAVAAWHHWDHGPIYDTEAVFREFGIEAVYIDIHASRGCELVYDLNYDVDWHAPKMDVVLDAGTTEHVFNIAQAWLTMRRLCRVGGHLIHINPINATNHGFWSVSPTAYKDFYSAFGDTILKAEIHAGPLGKREIYEMPMAERFGAPNNSWSLVVAQRSARAAQSYPQQSKYLKNPNLKGVL